MRAFWPLLMVSSALFAFEHPVDVASDGNLPLKYGRYMDCITCHSEHEGGKAHLRMKHQKLCQSCHQDQKLIGHVKESCSDCHDMHKAKKDLLHKPLNKQCIECHKDRAKEHTTKNTLIQTQRAKGIRFVGERISCNTCHVTHHAGNKLLIDPPKVKRFCSSCHDKKAEKLYKNFHSILKKN